MQRMRHIAAEKGKLKLVHPGRHIEVLREPVTVAELMSKNPRHLITRPDVFKFPWVVLKPDSVLPLGHVFLLVPNRTVYDLMKSENHRRQSTKPETTSFLSRRCSVNDTTIPNSNDMSFGSDVTPWLDEKNSYREFRRQWMAENDSKGESSSFSVGGGDGGRRSDVAELKSCMRKAESERRRSLVGLRVSFENDRDLVV